MLPFGNASIRAYDPMPGKLIWTLAHCPSDSPGLMGISQQECYLAVGSYRTVRYASHQFIDACKEGIHLPFSIGTCTHACKLPVRQSSNPEQEPPFPPAESIGTLKREGMPMTQEKRFAFLVLLILLVSTLLTAKPIPIDWQTTAEAWKGKTGTIIALSLPPKGTPEPVFGSGSYSWDSSIGSAAVHMGLITYAEGGEVGRELQHKMRGKPSINSKMHLLNQRPAGASTERDARSARAGF